MYISVYIGANKKQLNNSWIFCFYVIRMKSYLGCHKRCIPSSVDPDAVEGQLQTGVTLGQATAKVTDH